MFVSVFKLLLFVDSSFDSIELNGWQLFIFSSIFSSSGNEYKESQSENIPLKSIISSNILNVNLISFISSLLIISSKNFFNSYLLPLNIILALSLLFLTKFSPNILVLSFLSFFYFINNKNISYFTFLRHFLQNIKIN